MKIEISCKYKVALRPKLIDSVFSWKYLNCDHHCLFKPYYFILEQKAKYILSLEYSEISSCMKIIISIMCQLLYFLYSFCKHLFCQFPIMFCFYFLQGITDLFGTVCYILIFWCWDNSHVEVPMVSFHTYALFANLKQLCKRFFYFLFLKDGTVICATILKSGINVYRFENFNNENWWTADQKRCTGFFLIIFSFLQKRKFFSGGWSKKFWEASI